MGNIRYGTVEYFELLSLQDKIKSWRLDKFDLQCLDKLRMEVDIKLKAIHAEHNTKISSASTRRHDKT